MNKNILQKAGDIYNHWRKLIASAKSSLTVFSPYLDNILITLLKNTHDTNDLQGILILLVSTNSEEVIENVL
jgi:hypothetical protein